MLSSFRIGDINLLSKTFGECIGLYTVRICKQKYKIIRLFLIYQNIMCTFSKWVSKLLQCWDVIYRRIHSRLMLFRDIEKLEHPDRMKRSPAVLSYDEWVLFLVYTHSRVGQFFPSQYCRWVTQYKTNSTHWISKVSIPHSPILLQPFLHYNLNA